MTIARIRFGVDDQAAIRQLVGAMMFLLVVNFAVGVVTLGFGCLTSLGLPATFEAHPVAGVGSLLLFACSALYGVGMIGQGVTLVQARQALAAVVAADTADQTQLVIVFSRLKVFFALEGVLFVIGIGTQLGGTLVQLFGASAMMPGGLPGVVQ
jgi:hypothetical protein